MVRVCSGQYLPSIVMARGVQLDDKLPWTMGACGDEPNSSFGPCGRVLHSVRFLGAG